MGRLSPQNQMYIGIAIIVVLTLAVVFFGILPLFQESSSLDSEITTENGNLQNAQALLARRQSAKAQSAANEVELMRIANQVPDSPQLPSVIVELQDVANAAGLEMVSIAPADVAAVEPEAGGAPATYGMLSLGVILRGDWADHIDYFHRIDGLNRGVRVVSTTFTYIPGAEGEEGGEDIKAYVESNVTLEVYVMPAAASVGSATTPAPAPPATTPPAP